MSALERMKAQQSEAAVDIAQAQPADETELLQPAAGGLRTSVPACALAATNSAVNPAPTAFISSSADDFLASKRVSIQKTSFDKQWDRVLNDNVSSSPITRELGRMQDPVAAIEAVNRWVNGRIAYVEDRLLFNQADYWAGAKLTLALGRGDCEDIAITKMQMLAAAGFRLEDMFLTIAKDTLRRQDHALLVVRVDNSYVVLDNTTDALLDGSKAHDYRPVLSFSEGRSWVHGY